MDWRLCVCLKMSFWAIIQYYRRASGPIFPIFPYIFGLTRGVGRGGSRFFWEIFIHFLYKVLGQRSVQK